MSASGLRHRVMQTVFWTPAGASVVRSITSLQKKFNVVVRNYSLIRDSNGERWLLTILDDTGLVFDVGFYDGTTTKAIIEQRPNMRVIAFDPSRFARKSYDTGGFDTAKIGFENLAFSNAAGEATFYDYNNECNSLAARKEDMAARGVEKYVIPVTTIDHYCAAKAITAINLLKIDAEGFDLNVLEGAAGMLSEQRIDIFMFEFASGWAASKRYLWEVRDYFAPMPYSLFRLFNGFLCPFKYSIDIDSCTTHSAIYVGISKKRLSRSDVPIRNLDL